MGPGRLVPSSTLLADYSHVFFQLTKESSGRHGSREQAGANERHLGEVELEDGLHLLQHDELANETQKGVFVLGSPYAGSTVALPLQDSNDHRAQTDRADEVNNSIPERTRVAES